VYLNLGCELPANVAATIIPKATTGQGDITVILLCRPLKLTMVTFNTEFEIMQVLFTEFWLKRTTIKEWRPRGEIYSTPGIETETGIKVCIKGNEK
jgi:hypothetical protein